MSGATLARLLARRQVWLAGPGGDPAVALGRAALTRRLWQQYRLFDPLRRCLAPVRGAGRPYHPATPGERLLLADLERQGWLRLEGGTVPRCRTPEAERYLRGGWLEELAWLAVRAAGAEEASFGQAVEWEVDGHRGRNEVDVLAHRRGVLSFTSCKTACPGLSGDLRQRLDGYLLELGYWDRHFADDDGRTVLLVTADLVDESLGASRLPTLSARARVLDVDLVGLDHDRFDALVQAYRRHWE